MRSGRWGKSVTRPTGRAVSGRGKLAASRSYPRRDLEAPGAAAAGRGSGVGLSRTRSAEMELRFPFPEPVNPPPFGIPPGTSCSPQLSPISVPSLPTPSPAGPRCAHSLGDGEGTMTTLPQRGEGARGAGKTLALLCCPFPASATPLSDSEVTASGTKLEREGAGLLAVPWKLKDYF